MAGVEEEEQEKGGGDSGEEEKGGGESGEEEQGGGESGVEEDVKAGERGEYAEKVSFPQFTIDVDDAEEQEEEEEVLLLFLADVWHSGWGVAGEDMGVSGCASTSRPAGDVGGEVGEEKEAAAAVGRSLWGFASTGDSGPAKESCRRRRDSASRRSSALSSPREE